MEEGHLHNRVDTRGQSTFAGNFRCVNDVEMGLLLVQHGLDFLRQSIPHFVRIVRGIEQENAAGFQALRHLVFINKLQLMAANEIRL